MENQTRQKEYQGSVELGGFARIEDYELGLMINTRGSRKNPE
jgi:hypothetical protein